MKQMVSRWLLPLVLVFGLVGNAAATGDGSHGHGHGHGSGGSPSDDGFTKTFSEFFVDDAGETFDKFINFKIDGVSNLVTLKIASFDLSDTMISIFDKKTHVAVYQASFDDVLNASFSLNPGKYFALFTGSVSSDLAGYAAAASAVPVPEPAEWMMILAGVAMMGFVVSRRRNG